MLTLLLTLSCSEPTDTDDANSESRASATETESAFETASATETESETDTAWWECLEDGLVSETSLCMDHLLHTCEQANVGLRRGDYVCWPDHAFCPESPPCEGTSEGWASSPLAMPDDFLAVAEGVLAHPETVFASPIDSGVTYTTSHSYASLDAAKSALYRGDIAPGEEAVIADGTYSDCYIGVTLAGEADKPIRIRAETPGGVTLQSCAVYLSGSYVVLSDFVFTGEMVYTPIALGYSGAPCDYCAVRGVSIDMQPSEPMNRPYLQVYGRRAEISDSTFSNKANTSAVITVDRPDPADPIEARIYRNAFYDRSDALGGGATNGFEVIRVGYSGDAIHPSYTVIEGNLFERNDGEVETLSIKSGYNAVRFNTFRDNAGQISVRAGFGNVVEGNYILAQSKPDSGGIRVVGAHTLVVGNHIQDVDTRESIWRYPLTLTTGTDDHYSEYVPMLEGAVLLNRVISAKHAFTLDTGAAYGAEQDPPHDNLYQHNLLYTLGEEPVLSYGFEASLTQNTLSDNRVDTEVGLAGFTLHSDPVSTTGELAMVSAFEADISGLGAAALLEAAGLDGSGRLVLDEALIYSEVPVLEAGDVGAP